MRNGYEVWLDDMLLPITPPSMELSVGSKNETVDLINEGEINIINPPSLVEVSFTARFPMRHYPFVMVANVAEFRVYYDKLQSLKESRAPFKFYVTRYLPNNTPTWDYDLTVTLEEFTIQENAEEGDDVLVDITLKQYRDYSTKVKIIKEEEIVQPTLPPEPTRETPPPETQSYTIVSGDTLWGIARKFYGDGTQWGRIYDANYDAIEGDARNHGYQSSSNGHWIWPGLTLTIPT